MLAQQECRDRRKEPGAERYTHTTMRAHLAQASLLCDFLPCSDLCPLSAWMASCVSKPDVADDAVNAYDGVSKAASILCLAFVSKMVSDSCTKTGEDLSLLALGRSKVQFEVDRSEKKTDKLEHGRSHLSDEPADADIKAGLDVEIEGEASWKECLRGATQYPRTWEEAKATLKKATDDLKKVTEELQASLPPVGESDSDAEDENDPRWLLEKMQNHVAYNAEYNLVSLADTLGTMRIAQDIAQDIAQGIWEEAQKFTQDLASLHKEALLYCVQSEQERKLTMKRRIMKRRRLV